MGNDVKVQGVRGGALNRAVNTTAARTLENTTTPPGRFTFSTANKIEETG